MDVLVTCKYEEDPIKNEGARVDTLLYSNFSDAQGQITLVLVSVDAQGQLTPQSLVRSGRISNSSEMLWMFSLPASMKKIRSKMKALERTQHFPPYNPMGAIRCHGHQSSDPIWPKT